MNPVQETRENQAPGRSLGFRARRALLRLRLRRARSRFGHLGYGASRFLYVPPHLHLADPSMASDFLAGQIVLAGRSVLAGGRPILDLAAPSRAFAAALNGFEWLRHFEASGSTPVREGARRLLRQWLERREAGRQPDAELPEAVIRRVIAWTTHSALITENADFAFYRRLLRHLAMDAAMLAVLAETPEIGMLRLRAAIALMFHALALNRPAAAIAQGEKLLRAALADSIASDGGPRDRDAGTAIRLAADLVPLLALYRARQRAAPEFIGAALQKLIAFGRLMQHPDGALALFNGAGLVPRDLVSEVTRFASSRIGRPDSAPETGFERLEDENGVLIADAGVLPAPGFGGHAGAGALAFEYSTRTDRIIVNCGIPRAAEGPGLLSYLGGPAHSTMLLDDQAVATIGTREDLIGRHLHAPVSNGAGLVAERSRIEGHDVLMIGHDGLRAAYGYVLERRFALLPRGGLTALDRALDIDQRGETCRFTLAFHLHPRVLPVPLSRQDAVVLRLPHREPGQDMWLFEAPGFPLHLEESRCFEQETGLARTEAIILDVPISGTTEIRWRIVPYHG
ncbi:heparinase II/III family protein [Rhabdaerophilum calidifontis]|uniref:heparinase II/III family protein n=1 Tax=Rhabdaerophilum calidifontis TaxID=2604328 RepID=UPI00140A2FD9|nr:heparinase II/III family protein [Rhabdaerophilum calidifontis]